MGELLVIGLHETMTPEQLQQIRERLTEQWPGLSFALIAGVTALAVMRDDER
jgi:hypothetical protein